MRGSDYPAIAVRHSAQGDEPAIRELLVQLGQDAAPEQLRTQLRKLSESQSDAVLVATSRGAVVGFIALHWSIMLQQAALVGRITTLVVNGAAHGQGVGRTLVEAATDIARQAGCETLELTTALHRTEAHSFYKALGFTSSSLKFGRPISA